MPLSLSAATLFAAGPDIPADLGAAASRRDFWSAPRRVQSAAAAAAAGGAGLVPSSVLSAAAPTFIPGAIAEEPAPKKRDRGSRRKTREAGVQNHVANAAVANDDATAGESKAPGTASAAGRRDGKKKKKARKRARKSKVAAEGWWRSLDDTNVDPISLEPIRDLEYPPFEIVSDMQRRVVVRAQGV
jgi:hypothetical protein